jgi:hypothetical protein
MGSSFLELIGHPPKRGLNGTLSGPGKRYSGEGQSKQTPGGCQTVFFASSALFIESLKIAMTFIKGLFRGA